MLGLVTRYFLIICGWFCVMSETFPIIPATSRAFFILIPLAAIFVLIAALCFISPGRRAMCASRFRRARCASGVMFTGAGFRSRSCPGARGGLNRGRKPVACVPDEWDGAARLFGRMVPADGWIEGAAVRHLQEAGGRCAGQKRVAAHDESVRPNSLHCRATPGRVRAWTRVKG